MEWSCHSFLTTACLQNKNTSTECLKKNQQLQLFGSKCFNRTSKLQVYRLYIKRQSLQSFTQKTCSEKFTHDSAIWKEWKTKKVQHENMKKVNMKKVQQKKQHVNSVTRKKSNMKRVQHGKSLIWKECNKKNVQDQKSATWKKCRMKKYEKWKIIWKIRKSAT